MGWGRGWLWIPAFVGLAILFAVPAAALDVDVGWSLENAPTVVTLEATDIFQKAAVLRGSLDDLGGEASVEVSFEWGSSPALGTETAPQTLGAPATFEATLGELEAGTSYYFRAKAVGNGTATGETLTFQTAPAGAAGDLLSQLWLWLVLAAIAAVMVYLLTRRQLAARRTTGKAGAARQTPSKVEEGRGGLIAEAEAGITGARGVSEAPVADLGGALGATTPSEILCPHCGNVLAGGAVYCYGCGRGLTEGGNLEDRVEHARGTLAENERDRDALFTVGAHLAAAGEAKEALDVLNKLTMLDPRYPGLWWVKARVFEALGNPQAAEAAMMRAMRDEGGAGVEALLTAAGQIEANAESEGRDLPTRREIQKARKAELQAWCREFGLGEEGLVADLRIRLLGYLEAEAPPEEAYGEASSEAAEDEGPPKPETCPHCETTLVPETGNCPGCGRSVVDQGENMLAKVTRALAILESDENDRDALFTLGAYLLLDGKVRNALDTLNRLTLIDPDYPGLWWVKAQVFEKLGIKKAAESALARAQQGDGELDEEGQ